MQKSFFGILFLMLSSTLCFASIEQFPSSPWTREPNYSEKTINKLGFGFLNTLTGWSCLLFEPYRHSNLARGFGEGLLLSITSTAGGAVHALTFPIPVDVPLPGGGVHFDTE